MKATLIFPGITRQGWGCFGKANDSESVFIPHGLASIASYAQSAGHSIDAIDLRRLSGWDEFDLNIKERSPGVFGISSMTVDFGVTLQVIHRIKTTNKGSIVILGGVHATVALDDVKGNHDIDYIVTGEGEVSFASLLSHIESGGKHERIIKGISPDINSIPYPDRDMFCFDEGEMNAPWLPHMTAPFVSIIASRGCPHKCAFCQPAERAIFGGKARIRNVESVIGELLYLREKYNFQSLLIHDDYFAFNPKWIKRFCDAYRSNGFNQQFTCQVRSDFIVNNREIVAEMVDSGLTCFMVGFESGSQKMLDFIKKETTVEMNKEAVEICRQYGIKIFANYMMGLPTESREDVIQTVDFINWAMPDYPSPAFFTPHPGSELYNYCEEHSLSLIKSYKSYARNPDEPKIKGVDYNFLNIAVCKSTEYKIDQRLEYLKNISDKSVEEGRAERELLAHKSKLTREYSQYIQEFRTNQTEKKDMGLNQKKSNNENKVLVTGGTGFIGSAVVQKLLEKNYPVTVLTRNGNHPNAKYFASKGASIVQGSVEDWNSIERLQGFQHIFHFAVFQGTEGQQMFDVNVGGTENIVKIASREQVKHFVYASSIEAQGTNISNSVPLDESFECRPVSEYGKSKLEGEQVVRKYMDKKGLAGIIARIGNVYGVGGLSFIHSLSTSIIEKNILLQSLPVIGNRIVQPIYINDLVNAFVMTIENDGLQSGIYNFTGHQPALIKDWFREIAILLGLENNIDDAMQREVDRNSIPDLKKAHAHINYFLSGDEPCIHRFYTDHKLIETIGDYQSHSLTKGLAYTLEWCYRSGYFNSYIAA